MLAANLTATLEFVFFVIMCGCTASQNHFDSVFKLQCKAKPMQFLVKSKEIIDFEPNQGIYDFCVSDVREDPGFSAWAACRSIPDQNRSIAVGTAHPDPKKQFGMLVLTLFAAIDLVLC